MVYKIPYTVNCIHVDLYRLSTGNAVVKTAMTILYRLLSSFAVVKWAWRTSTDLKQAFCQYKKSLQFFNKLCDSQKVLLKLYRR